MPMGRDGVGKFMQSSVVTNGLASGPDQPPGFYLIATFVFDDQKTLDARIGLCGTFNG